MRIQYFSCYRLGMATLKFPKAWIGFFFSLTCLWVIVFMSSNLGPQWPISPDILFCMVFRSWQIYICNFLTVNFFENHFFWKPPRRHFTTSINPAALATPGCSWNKNLNLVRTVTNNTGTRDSTNPAKKPPAACTLLYATSMSHRLGSIHVLLKIRTKIRAYGEISYVFGISVSVLVNAFHFVIDRSTGAEKVQTDERHHNSISYTIVTVTCQHRTSFSSCCPASSCKHIRVLVCI